ncbi:hypothetical protein PV326_012752, partial [Microctonus aethiopoides]
PHRKFVDEWLKYMTLTFAQVCYNTRSGRRYTRVLYAGSGNAVWECGKPQLAKDKPQCPPPAVEIYLSVDLTLTPLRAAISALSDVDHHQQMPTCNFM